MITVRFVSPANDTAGLKIATLSVADAAGTQTSALTGTVTLLAITPASQNFGTVSVSGTTASMSTFTVVNQGNTAATIDPVMFSTGDFTRPSGTAGGTCGATIAASPAACTIIVRFKPLAPVTPTARSAVMAVGAEGTAPTRNLTGTAGP